MVGHDEDHDDELRAIEFDRIKGGKRFDPTVDWFTSCWQTSVSPAADVVQRVSPIRAGSCAPSCGRDLRLGPLSVDVHILLTGQLHERVDDLVGDGSRT